MSTSKTLAAAALAGLLVTGAVATVAKAAEHNADKTASKEAAKEKHACKGQNSCKGQGADGKNACKGKGSCATDGSKPAGQ